ncbi:MAG: AAA family ATPase [Candidatus Methylacidiphilales bacterium]
MANAVKSISIEGFKSISSLEKFYLGSLNILIGANGAGKSNFIEFFRMLRAMAEEGLRAYIRMNGGADGFFFDGPKVTREISAVIEFGTGEYSFQLTSAVNNAMVVIKEKVFSNELDQWFTLTNGGEEADLKLWSDTAPGSKNILKKAVTDDEEFELLAIVAGKVLKAASSWIVYHFHDTSANNPLRRDQNLRDHKELRADAENIAAFLYNLRESSDELHKASYQRIRRMIQIVAPFFDDFTLEPHNLGSKELIRLEWKQKGSSFPFQSMQFSDGTLRFICLATALLQPDPPCTIVIDEPELGLHPVALDLLASLVKEAAMRTQVIVSTQSPTFLNSFEPEDIIVVDRVNSSSRFRRLIAGELREWLDEYSLGDLVQKNVIEAGPRYA